MFAGLLAGAAAQEAPAAESPRTIAVGQEILLASYHEVHPASCRPLRAPLVRITTPPRLGSATVVRSQQMPVDTGRCQTVAAPLVQVRYRARQPGADWLAWEVAYQDRATGTQRVRAQIQVRPDNRVR
ncbi:hypothetical protein BPNSA17_45430 [Bordetella petrii]